MICLMTPHLAQHKATHQDKTIACDQAKLTKLKHTSISENSN
jgi:hypothetical protein